MIKYLDNIVEITTGNGETMIFKITKTIISNVNKMTQWVKTNIRTSRIIGKVQKITSLYYNAFLSGMRCEHQIASAFPSEDG